MSAKDFGTVAGLMADDIVWHQPGANRFSGTHQGRAAVDQLLGAMMTVSAGTRRRTAEPLKSPSPLPSPSDVVFRAQCSPLVTMHLNVTNDPE
ncbi:nuclear transport factor 2 family protein [Kribbella sp. NPDC023972]|uniref:nuclear transport factor 2 family protein n=1 Tax=Kribbella sp. NPDC023972 TaxID=3154795 RepID=UPI00340A718B